MAEQQPTTAGQNEPSQPDYVAYDQRQRQLPLRTILVPLMVRCTRRVKTAATVPCAVALPHCHSTLSPVWYRFAM